MSIPKPLAPSKQPPPPTIWDIGLALLKPPERWGEWALITGTSFEGDLVVTWRTEKSENLLVLGFIDGELRCLWFEQMCDARRR